MWRAAHCGSRVETRALRDSTFEGDINMERSDEYYIGLLAALSGTECEELDRDGIKMIDEPLSDSNWLICFLFCWGKTLEPQNKSWALLCLC